MPDYCLNWTMGPVLYKGDKGINDAACPPKGGPPEVNSLSASSLLLSIFRPAWMTVC